MVRRREEIGRVRGCFGCAVLELRPLVVAPGGAQTPALRPVALRSRPSATRTCGAHTPAVPPGVPQRPSVFSNSCPKPFGFLKLRPCGPSHPTDSRSSRGVATPRPSVFSGSCPSASRQFNTPKDEHYIEFPGVRAARSRRSGADPGFPAGFRAARRMERFVQ